jgi:hypothetical protein
MVPGRPPAGGIVEVVGAVIVGLKLVVVTKGEMTITVPVFEPGEYLVDVVGDVMRGS